MILFLFIFLLSWMLSLFLPWWSLVIPGLAFGFYFNMKSLPSFGYGFLAIFLLWGIQAVVIHIQNDGILTTRIADLLGIGSPVLIILITALIGGIVGGLSSLTGSLFNTKRVSPNLKKS